MKVKFFLAALFMGAALAAAVPAQAKTLTITYNSDPDSIRGRTSAYLAERLAIVSGNRLTLKVNGNVGAKAMSALPAVLEHGDSDMAMIIPARLADEFKSFHIFNLPFLFNSMEDAQEQLSSTLGEYLRDELHHGGLILLGWMCMGARQLGADKPIRKESDFDGMTIGRTAYENDYSIFSRFGAYVEEYPEDELYTVFANQGVDILEDTYVNFWRNRVFNKYSGYLIETNHKYRFLAVIISEHTYNKLTARERGWLNRAVYETELAEWSSIKQENDKARDQMIKAGVTFSVFNTEDLRDSAEKVRQVYAHHFPELMRILEDHRPISTGKENNHSFVAPNF